MVSSKPLARPPISSGAALSSAGKLAASNTDEKTKPIYTGPIVNPVNDLKVPSRWNDTIPEHLITPCVFSKAGAPSTDHPTPTKIAGPWMELNVGVMDERRKSQPITTVSMSTDLWSDFEAPEPKNRNRHLARYVYIAAGGKNALLQVFQIRQDLIREQVPDSGTTTTFKEKDHYCSKKDGGPPPPPGDEEEIDTPTLAEGPINAWSALPNEHFERRMTLVGHERTITKVQFVDARATGGLLRGHCEELLEGCDGLESRELSFPSPQHLLLISVATDRKIKIWQVISGLCLWTHCDTGMLLGTAVLLPRVPYLMYASSSHKLQLVDGNQKLQQAVKCDFETWCLKHDGKRSVLAGTKNGCLRVLDIVCKPGERGGGGGGGVGGAPATRGRARTAASLDAAADTTSGEDVEGLEAPIVEPPTPTEGASVGAGAATTEASQTPLAGDSGNTPSGDYDIRLRFGNLE